MAFSDFTRIRAGLAVLGLGAAIWAAPLAAVAQGVTEGNPATGAALLARGDTYSRGASGAPDLEAAYESYLLAADAGAVEGYARAGEMKETGRVTSGDRADDNFEATMLYQIGAEAGCFSCMMSVARMYETAPAGVEKNLAEALVWYTKAYNRSPLKSDMEFSSIKRVSSAAYDVAIAEMQAGNHWEAYQAFKTLCGFKGPGACYWLGMYQGAGNSPYGKDVPASLTPLAFACDHSVPNACQVHANLTGFVGPKAGYSNGYRAERFFKSLCDAASPNYSACFNVAWLNYYTDYGLNNWTTIQTYAGKSCWQGGHGGGCDLAFTMAQMTGPPPGSQATSSGGNWGKSVDNVIGGIFGALLSGSESYAATGSVGSSRSYSSGSSSSSSSSSAWQDNRDWNEARRATANIGTAYSSSCRPGNTYC